MLKSLTILALLTAPAFADPRQPKREVAEKSADPYDKVICKRFVRTGSLVDGYRSCKTKWEWERERDAINTNRPGIGCNDPGSPACRPDSTMLGTRPVPN